MSELTQCPVLLVEDDTGIAKLLQRALVAKGMRVDHVPSAEEAILLLREGRAYSVAVIDLLLKEYSSGFYAIEWLKARTTEMPVVVITAAESKVLANIDRSVVKAILLKPLDPEVFAEFIVAMAARTNPVAVCA